MMSVQVKGRESEVWEWEIDGKSGERKDLTEERVDKVKRVKGGKALYCVCTRTDTLRSKSYAI